jgi:hypothetical protein
VNYLPLAKNVLMAGTIQAESGVNVSGVIMNGIMPGYFGAIGTKFVAGREFENDPGKLAEPSVIVNEAFARQSGLGSNMIGKKIIAPWTKQPYSISGVVVTARMGGPGYEGDPQVYWPVEEEPPAALTYVAKIHGDVRDYLPRCRDAVVGLDRTVPVYEVKTLDQRLNETLGQPRFYTAAVLFIGSLSFLIAVAGVYSTSSRTVTQRQHELGVRVALGASIRSVRHLILRQTFTSVGIGILAGVAGGIGCGFVLRHLFVGAREPDLMAFIVASLLLMFVATSTAWSATSRILRIDPMEAIRAE